MENLTQKEMENNVEKITIKAIINDDFSYVDYHTDCKMKVTDERDATEFSFIDGIEIKNTTNNFYENVIISFKFASEAFSSEDIHLAILNEHTQTKLRMPFINVNKAVLDTIVETVPSSLKIILSTFDGTVICENEQQFNILAVSQLSKNVFQDQRLYAKLVTPLALEVKRLTLKATKMLNKNIIAYQNKDKNAFLREIEAIYLALHTSGINYQNPPAGGLVSQRIRMPEEVIKDKKGTCIDLSILFCACLEELGFHSVLVLIDGHAMASVFMEDKNTNAAFNTTTFKNGIETNFGIVNNMIGDKLIVLNAVDFCTLSNLSFNEAMNDASNILKAYQGVTFYAVDINTCHKTIFSPIPVNGSNEELQQLIKPTELNDQQLDPVIDSKYVNVLKHEEKDRFTFWEKKLLDLSEANPLVNFRMRSGNCIRYIAEGNIADMLLKNETLKTEMIIENMPKDDFDDYLFRANLKPSDLLSIPANENYLYGIGYDKTLKTLIRKSKSAMDETGASTLYLCLGLLTYTRKKGKIKGTAPFMVLPIKKFTKDKMGYTYTISFDIDDLMLNQTFFEYYKLEHEGVDFSALYNVTLADGYMNIVRTFKNNNTENIALDESAFFVANLTFSHYIMWLDVRKRKEDLRRNQVIQSIIANKNMVNEIPEFIDKPVDEIEKYENFAAPLPYDSTQLRAILECGAGRSFILDGPPGTGKSQTIVNMIVNAFYHGKTVLFVAEKKAALDVVSDRLEKIQLGRFCLELHSNKANKDDFYKKLADSMDMGPTKDPIDFDKKCEELDSRRNHLLKIINSMHLANEYYLSFYDAIVTKKSLEDEGNYASITFNENFLLGMNSKKHDEIDALLDRFIHASKEVSNFDENPLKLLKIQEINFNDKDKVITDFTGLKSLLNVFKKSFLKLSTNASIKLNENLNDTNNFVQALNILLNETIYFENIDKFQANSNDEKALELFNKAKNVKSFASKYKDKYDFTLIESADPKPLLSIYVTVKGFFKILSFKGKCKKLIKSVLKPKVKLNSKVIKTYLEEIEYYNDNLRFVKANSKSINKYIGLNFEEHYLDVLEIEDSYKKTREFYNICLNLAKENSIVDVLLFMGAARSNPALKLQLNETIQNLNALKKYEGEISTKYSLDYKAILGTNDEYKKYLALIDYINDPENFNELVSIALINQIGVKLNALGLSELLNLSVNNLLNVTDLKKSFELSLANGIIALYFKNNSDINYFNPSEFDREIEKYKDTIQEYSNIVVESVSAKLTKNLNHNAIDYKNSSPIGQLKKTFSMKKGKPAIRDTLLKYDDIMKKYFPCFLMSPLSAAQYLAVDEESGKKVTKFDLVIFDEASQIPTHEAIGPIARGNSLIVAGDPLQMPPSSYFSAGLELEPDDMVFDDADSLLDECIAIEIPRIRLSYHYRSKHESLIGFSNKNFYNDNLYTFPSTSTTKSEIEFRYVDLLENKKNSDISKAELEAICNTYTEIYTNPKTMNKSLGIIVFNMKQKDEVDEAIDSLLDKNKALARQVEKARELTNDENFVKSLENVQGDERDIIILSIGFRLSASGHPVLGGPICQVNGERRLNVAASRSKEKMIVISTIKYHDFEDDSKLINKSRGSLFLKRFLGYAEAEKFDASITNKEEKASTISFIQNDLKKLGYDVVTNVGNSLYRVDLAVKNKSGDKYDLGLLIDSKPIVGNISCRDKLFLQDSFLRTSLKWKIKNIYSIEYYKDPKKTIEKIISEIGKEPDPVEVFTIAPHIEAKPLEKFHYDTIPYTKARNLRKFEYLPATGFESDLIIDLSRIIDAEGPVSFETIKGYVREYCPSLAKISKKAEEYLNQALAQNFKHRTVDKDEDNKTIYFYWPTDDTNMSKFRIYKRDIYDISKEEILAAMTQVLKVQGTLSEEDLFKATLDAFEYGESVLSNKNRTRLAYVYNWGKLHSIIK